MTREQTLEEALNKIKGHTAKWGEGPISGEIGRLIHETADEALSAPAQTKTKVEKRPEERTA